MKEHPILFSSPMVRAILAGKKTQTRRVIVGDPDDLRVNGDFLQHCPNGEWHNWLPTSFSPYGTAGEQLWVREKWRVSLDYGIADRHRIVIEYAAGGQKTFARPDGEHLPGDKSRMGSWRPSIFMPHWASRIALEIVSVRAERLHAITEADALLEGVSAWRDQWTARELEKRFGDIDPLMASPRYCFAKLWDEINTKRGYPWESNPYVWVIEFMRVDR